MSVKVILCVFQCWQLMVEYMILLNTQCIALFDSIETKQEEEEEAPEVKKRVPLSLEELLAKKKAEEEAESKVGLK